MNESVPVKQLGLSRDKRYLTDTAQLEPARTGGLRHTVSKARRSHLFHLPGDEKDYAHETDHNRRGW